MPLSLSDQFSVAMSGVREGDINQLSRLLTAPDSITTEDTQSVAEGLGVKNPWLQTMVNVATDPIVLAGLFLSARFPTAQFLKGTVPHRFLGANSEFSGLSTVGRVVEDFFRGSNVPSLVALKMRRESEVMKIGNRMFDKILVRPNWDAEMPVVSQLLEGQVTHGATPELKNLAHSLRGDMNELWGFLQKTQKVSGGFDGVNITRASSRPFTPSEAPKFLRDYLPHLPILENESTLTLSGSEAVQRLARGRGGQALSLSKENPAQVWRQGANDSLSASYGDFQRFMERTQGQVFNPRLFQRKRMGLTVQGAAAGQELFVTDLNILLERYVHSTARTYALNAPLSQQERAIARSFIESTPGVVREIRPTSEPIITQIINEGLDTAGPSVLSTRRVRGTQAAPVQALDTTKLNPFVLTSLKQLVREVQGKSDLSDVAFGSVLNNIRRKASTLFSGTKGHQVSDAIDTVSRQTQDRQLTSKISSFFYSTTLGLNFSSALKNLFQPFLTTAPTLGLGPTLQGYRALRQRLPQYANAFIQENRALRANPQIPRVRRALEAQQRAFRQVFPELEQAGIKADPRAFELSEAALLEDLKGKGRFSSSDDYFKFLLQPFQQTELSNQVVSFFGGKAALKNALRTGELERPILAGAPIQGKALDDYLNFEASRLVNATQFRPGPGSRTSLQALLPGPFRMFTSFPVRFGNFMSQSTVRGALLDSELKERGILARLTGGRNLGTLARVLVTGRAVTEGLRNTLGVDMADAVGVTGPFSGAVSSGRLFAPLPLAPFPGVIASLASFATTRDVRELQPLTLPVVGDVPVPRTLIPGGVAITRAVRAYQSFRPDLGGFVDDDERLMLQGDTGDLIMGMLGVPLDKERRMREQLDRVNSNRLRIKGLRRDYAVAHRRFDTQGMAKAQARFRKEFPDDPVGLGVTFQDVRRYDEQARMTSVQRLLRTTGRRAPFLEAQIYASDPDLINLDGGRGGGF